MQHLFAANNGHVRVLAGWVWGHGWCVSSASSSADDLQHLHSCNRHSPLERPVRAYTIAHHMLMKALEPMNNRSWTVERVLHSLWNILTFLAGAMRKLHAKSTAQSSAYLYVFDIVRPPPLASAVCLQSHIVLIVFSRCFCFVLAFVIKEHQERHPQRHRPNHSL